MIATLHHRVLGPAIAPAEPNRAPTVVVLHGILGASGNWRSFVRAAAAKAPKWRFLLVDMRNHGASQGASGPHTLAATTADIAALLDGLGLRADRVWGHSFGGKIGLALAATRPDLVGTVWALDSPPGERPLVTDGLETPGASGSDVVAVIKALRTVPNTLPSRNALIEHLGKQGLSNALARWMTTNMARNTDGTYGLIFDLDAIEAMLADYAANDYWGFLASTPGDRPAIVQVVADQSARWSPACRGRLAALVASGHCRSVLIAEAGHWLHVDQPEALLDCLLQDLDTDGGPHGS